MLNAYKKMAIVRQFEQAIAKASDLGKTPGMLHLGLGSEALTVAVCTLLSVEKDRVTASHRGHAPALVMGNDILAVAKEIMGKMGGLSDGIGGTQHLIYPESGFIGSNGIVGAQVPLAVGAALTAKMMNTGGIAVAFFGDGASNQGSVFESMNLAVALKLPMVFMLENNGYGLSTKVSAVAGTNRLITRAAGFGLKTLAVDGSDYPQIISILKSAFKNVRAGEGPLFVEAKVPRLTGHYHGDEQAYRLENETPTIGGADDPLVKMQQSLLSGGANHDDLVAILQTVQAEIDAVTAAAIAAPAANPVVLDRFVQALSPIAGGQTT